MSKLNKIKIVRVVTASYIVPWHLDNFLKRVPQDVNLYVVGDAVSKYRNVYSNISFIDIRIERKISLLCDLIALFKLFFLFLQVRPTIVHSIMPKSGLLSSLAGFLSFTPIRIHTYTGQVWATKKGAARMLLKFMDKFISQLNTVCFADSKSQANFLQYNGIEYHKRRIPVIGGGSLGGVDLDRFKSKYEFSVNEVREKLSLSKEHFVFIYLARKTKDKGALDMLHAFKLLSDEFSHARLLFVGPDEDGLIDNIRKDNLKLFHNVIDVGVVNDRENYLAVSNVMCMPSYREGFGSIVIEAAAMEVPAIGTNISGLVDSISEGVTGFLVEPGNVNDLYKYMKRFITSPDLVEKMGSSAKDFAVENFSADYIAQELFGIYMKLAVRVHQT